MDNIIEERNCLPVWRCIESYCQEQWATNQADAVCPFCHESVGIKTGFTYGEACEAAEKYGFEEILIHVPNLVPELVQLTEISKDLWIGLPVYHPLSQSGVECNWLTHDLGILTEFYHDPDIKGVIRCRFVTSHIHSLEYMATNLWVPKSLVDRLLGRGKNNR